ncbi:MAG: hypothetical protein PHH40_03120 [Candidatus Moranbacteria bacterium]|nr:hypothetical protein [Candidatus Moranbacteria bacterium]
MFYKTYLYSKKENNTKLVEQQVLMSTETTSQAVWDPKGSIYLSLAPNNGNDFGIYQYDISKNILAPYSLLEKGIAFSGKFKTATSEELLVSEIRGDETQITGIEGNIATTLTDSMIQKKRHPSYSVPYDALIYSGKEENAEALGRPNEFNVYMQKAGNQEQKIAQGAMPILTPDGRSVVVLRNDGLYKIDLEDKSSEHIWKTESDGVSFNQQFSLSPNGKYIAWSYPDGGDIYVFEVSSWSPFEATFMYDIKSHAFWPIFSPDEKYIAFEEVDWTDPPTQARLVIMNLATQEKRNLLDLTSFDQLSLFVDDWK